MTQGQIQKKFAAGEITAAQAADLTLKNIAAQRDAFFICAMVAYAVITALLVWP